MHFRQANGHHPSVTVPQTSQPVNLAYALGLFFPSLIIHKVGKKIALLQKESFIKHVKKILLVSIKSNI